MGQYCGFRLKAGTEWTYTAGWRSVVLSSVSVSYGSASLVGVDVVAEVEWSAGASVCLYGESGPVFRGGEVCVVADVIVGGTSVVETERSSDGYDGVACTEVDVAVVEGVRCSSYSCCVGCVEF